MKDNVFNQASCEAFFELMNFFGQNSSWLDHADVKTNVLKNFADDNTLTFIPAQDKPFTEGKLHSWGVEGYTDKKFADSNKVTGFYGDVGKYAKLKDSFDTDPYSTFFARYRTVDEYGSFTDGTNHYTLHDFPKFFHRKQKELKRLQGLRDAELKRFDTGGEELRTAQDELDKAKKAVKDKETEIDNKIAGKVAELRKELETKYKVSDTKSNNFTGDDKVTYEELSNFRRLVEQIRFLVNRDEEKPTGKTNEDSSYVAGKAIIDKYVHDFFHDLNSFEKVGYDKKGGQQKVDSYELKDSDKAKFDEFLYECAIGKINYNSLEKPTEEQHEDEDPNKDKNEKWLRMNN
ncbi:5928_t:CDS:2 [Ambispora gerdemannii]|uniref:5928_t:CDS:1 n=1 Tax=Ambispora gerdemannii TaxID=144530 RepID=A0A9N8V0H8_9GLOM|nr:5928_t:CDS:2 [Ambispora gerdemannii]